MNKSRRRRCVCTFRRLFILPLQHDQAILPGEFLQHILLQPAGTVPEGAALVCMLDSITLYVGSYLSEIGDTFSRLVACINSAQLHD